MIEEIVSRFRVGSDELSVSIAEANLVPAPVMTALCTSSSCSSSKKSVPIKN